ncbi:hypothetical protein F4861DRAFT_540485 [Xylaria intraflava]|nr:hypothetical protein F4861DRAFT_540485 [Xylaria intraflava]
MASRGNYDISRTDPALIDQLIVSSGGQASPDQEDVSPGFPPGSSHPGFQPASSLPRYPLPDSQRGYTPGASQAGYPPAGSQPGYPPGSSSQSAYPPLSSQPGYPPRGQPGLPPARPPAQPAPNARQTELACERAKRKSRKRPRDHETDEIVDALVAQADEQTSRRQREVRWEHFLHGEQKQPRIESLLNKIIGGSPDPDSKVYEEERRAVLALHRRFQTETLTNSLKFCRTMIQGDEGSAGSWASLSDPRIDYSDDVIMETISSSWSWDRFFIVWHWMRHYLDGEASQPLAQYYCRQLWMWNILETMRYIRISNRNPRETSDAQKNRIVCYVSLPSHPNFQGVERSLFVEKSPTLKNLRGSKKQRKNPAVALAHMKMEPPPPRADVLDDDEEEEYEAQP